MTILSLIGCEKETDKSKNDLSNINGNIEIHRCFCAPSAYRYLIVTIKNGDTVYYNPINLSDDYKDYNYKVIFSADILNDSSIIYTNTADDNVIEDFKVRNIRLINIKKCSDLIINDVLEIHYSRTYYNYVEKISIKVDSGLEDSRCPIGVMCKWEGNAKVRFDFSLKEKLTIFSLNTANSFLKDTLITGYKIQMLGLNPYPVYPEFIRQNDYKTIILISKLD